MSAQENVQVVQRAYAAFSRGDIPALLNTLTEDVEWFIPGPPQILPYAGQRRGREGSRSSSVCWMEPKRLSVSSQRNF
jgi:ketosteroid isomerase-like protein